MSRPLGERSVMRGAIAVVGGLATWLVGHTLTHLAWDQLHHAEHAAEPTVHVESAVATLGVAFLAIVLAGLGVAHRRDGGAAGRWLTRHGLGLLGPLVFVAAEFTAHLGEAHGAPPLALLVMGTAVHATVGALAPSLVIAAFTSVRAAVRVLDGPIETDGDMAMTAVAEIALAWSTTFQKACWASRAPPRHAVSILLPPRQVLL